MTRTPFRTLLAVLLTALLTVALAACGDDDDDEATGGDTATTVGEETTTRETTGETGGDAPAQATIKDFTFSAATAPAGDEVTVRNEDQAPHTYTSDEGGFDTRVEPGSQATVTAPEDAGTYDVRCKIHANMRGQLTVT